MRRVFRRNNATCPRRAKEPILLAELDEVLVVGRGISKVSNVEKDSIEVLCGPLWIVLAGYGSSVNVISIMEVVVVIVACVQ